MRYSQSEKMEIIRTVEESDLSVRRILEELDVNRSTFYRWYQCYQDNGYDGLINNSPSPKKFWNRLPEHVREQVVDIVLEEPDKSPRELARPILSYRPVINSNHQPSGLMNCGKRILTTS